MSCQRCGQPLAPNMRNCPRCGAPAMPAAGMPAMPAAGGWSQPQPPAMSNPFAPAGAPPMGQGGFGAMPQPPQFSAGSLISDNDLPEWLREGAAGQSAQPAWGAPPQQAPQPPRQPAFQQPQQPPMSPPMPPLPQSWGAPPAPQRAGQQQDIATEHTVRQPAYGQQGPIAPVAPQPAFNQQPSALYSPQGGFAQPQAYPPQAFAPQPYPSAPQGYPSAPQPYPSQPAFAQPPSYPSQFAPQQGMPGYPPQPASQPAPAQAFPSLDQVGALYNSPQAPGMSGYSLLNPQSGASWLGGMAQPGQFTPRQPVPSGMMARSLVDDQQLPKWLRDQPEAARPNPAEWAAQGQAAAAPQQAPAGYALAPSAVQPLPPSPAGPPLGSMTHAPAPQMGGYQRGYAEDAAMPDWLRAQAAAAPAAHAAPAAGQAPVQSFAASDLIDPAALPAWVTGKAPVEQTFSSTHGWSTINGESPAANGSEMAQGYGMGYDAPQDLQAPPEAPFGWDEAGNPAPWNEAGAPAEQGYDENASFGASPQFDERGGFDAPPTPEARFNPGHAPLAHEELPPWLQNKVGKAPQAAGNPWGNAAEQMPPVDSGWGEAGWGEQGEQQWDENAAWDENASWDDPRGGRAGGGRDERWDESPRDSGRGGYRDDGRGSGRDDGYDRRGRRDEMSYDDGAYDDERQYNSRRDERRDDLQYGDRQYDERRDDRRRSSRRAEPEYEYEDEHEQRGGRGWFGFMRRGRR